MYMGTTLLSDQWKVRPIATRITPTFSKLKQTQHSLLGQPYTFKYGSSNPSDTFCESHGDCTPKLPTRVTTMEHLQLYASVQCAYVLGENVECGNTILHVSPFKVTTLGVACCVSQHCKELVHPATSHATQRRGTQRFSECSYACCCQFCALTL